MSTGGDDDILLRETIRAFVTQRLVLPHAMADVHRISVLTQELSAMGLMGMLVPSALGGSGMTLRDALVIGEEIARERSGLSLMLGVHNLLVLPLLVCHGSEPQKQEWLPKLISGELWGCFALTESEAGSDAYALTTTATPTDDGGWELNGTKTWVTNASLCGLALVWARMPESQGKEGISGFWVRLDSPGVEVAAPYALLGMQDAAIASVHFRHVKVSHQALLGEMGAGARYISDAFVLGRLGVAAQALGIARAAYETARKYACVREQFGRAIVKNQGIQWMLADMATAVHSAELLLDMAVKKGGAYAARLAKWWVSDVALRVSRDAVQLHGGYGFMREFPVERWYRDAKVTQIYGGANEIHARYIGRCMQAGDVPWVSGSMLSISDQQWFADARAWIANHIAPDAKEADVRGAISQEVLKAVAHKGWMTFHVSSEWGGIGLGPNMFAEVMIALAQACPSTAITISVTNMVMEAIFRFGSAEQKAKYLPVFGCGDKVTAAFALTESGSGSDAARMQTRAIRDDDHYVLSGSKLFITSGAYADVFLVFATTDPELGTKGIGAFLVDRDTAGLGVGKVEEKMGLRGSNTVEVTFSQCRVSASALLGVEGEGFGMAMALLDGGRISVAAQAVGIGQAALAHAQEYANQRRTFGKTLAEHTVIADKLAAMRRQIEVARALLFEASDRKAQGLTFSLDASMAKLFASEACNAVCTDAVQISGAEGLKTGSPVERLFRDIKVTTLYEGTSEIQRLVIAKHIIPPSS